MKNVTLRSLFVFITGICVGLAVGIFVGTEWHFNFQFGTYPETGPVYSVEIINSSTGEVQLSSMNIEPPSLPPPGSENDPQYQAEIRENQDGTISLLPAPAFRRKS